MNTLVIGCEIMRNELLAAVKECKKNYEITWMEARLHNSKAKLNTTLQKILDQNPDRDRILLATGFCGNSIAGLKNGPSTLVIPRVDDCTSLLLGSCHNKSSYRNSYFLTEGWLTSEPNIWTEYTYSLNKYGPEVTHGIFQMMFAHYTSFALVDTGSYPVEPALERAAQIADTFHLSCRVIPGTICYLKDLLNGPWDNTRFLTVPPYGVVEADNLRMTY